MKRKVAVLVASAFLLLSGSVWAWDETGETTKFGQMAGAGSDADYGSFFGYAAGNHNTDAGTYNSFFGAYAGVTNTDGRSNSFLGYAAGYSNTNGNNNSFLGYAAGYFSSTGSYNNFIGAWAGYSNTTGSYNSSIGVMAGYSNTTGSNNSFLGYGAGYTNTSGVFNNFIGSDAGRFNTTGHHNSFIGGNAGQSNTTGSYNSFFGIGAGRGNTIGNRNTFIGKQAGFSNQTGNGNVFVGYQAGYRETGSNTLYIANGPTTTPLIYGEFDTKHVIINGILSEVSDVRLKKDIEPLKSSLDKVVSLQGVSYSWKADGNNGKGLARSRDIGLVAQDVEAVIPEVVHTDNKGFKSLSYDRLVPVLVEAIKEQQETITEQKAAIKALTERLTKLETGSNR